MTFDIFSVSKAAASRYLDFHPFYAPWSLCWQRSVARAWSWMRRCSARPFSSLPYSLPTCTTAVIQVPTPSVLLTYGVDHAGSRACCVRECAACRVYPVPVRRGSLCRCINR